MKINSSFSGTKLKDYHTVVTPRAVMNYAAAVEDPNPAYFDDTGGRTIIAHPMFAAALTWPVQENILDYITDTAFPKDILRTRVHYTEHLEFHRPVLPGDELDIKSVIAAVMPHRAGTVIVVRHDASDKAGSPVFTEHIGGMLRGVECTGGAGGTDAIPQVPSNGYDGPPMAGRTIHVDRLRPYIYDGCTNIHFPIHTSSAFAHMVGLPDIILQGTAAMAFAVSVIVNTEAGGDPRRIGEIYCRFTGMVVPPEDININLLCKRESAGGSGIFFEVTGKNSAKVLSGGYAKITG